MIDAKSRSTHEPFFKLGKSLNLPQTAILSIRGPKRIPLLEEDAFAWYESFDDVGECQSLAVLLCLPYNDAVITNPVSYPSNQNITKPQSPRIQQQYSCTYGGLFRIYVRNVAGCPKRCTCLDMALAAQCAPKQLWLGLNCRNRSA